AAVGRVIDRPVQERFDAGDDDAQGRLQLVADVGHELLPQSFEAAEVGGVVQHQDRAAARGPLEPGDVNGQVPGGRAAPVELCPGRLAAGQRLLDQFQHAAPANDFPELVADHGRRGKIEQGGGAVVGEADALAGVDGHHALDHAPQDGAELFAVGFEL